ncbi:MAG TPA: hypothetical protein VH592_13295 [Gemmataceae bacterium]|jgi:hypothetical protein
MQISKDRVKNACYKHINPHLELLDAEQDTEQCLPMMEPRIFSGFASQAASDVAIILCQSLREQYRSLTRYFDTPRPELEVFDVGDSGVASCEQWLREGLQEFQGDLQRYGFEYQRFCQVAGQSRQAAWRAGVNVATAAFSMFEGITALMGTVAGSLVAGKRIDEQVRVEYERFCRAQKVMLGSYDQAMSKLYRMADALLFQHYQRLTDAIRACQ